MGQPGLSHISEGFGVRLLPFASLPRRLAAGVDAVAQLVIELHRDLAGIGRAPWERSRS
jgi:hypothetical protein